MVTCCTVARPWPRFTMSSLRGDVKRRETLS
jgi:hypothetical protein